MVDKYKWVDAEIKKRHGIKPIIKKPKVVKFKKGSKRKNATRISSTSFKEMRRISDMVRAQKGEPPW